jgi:opacity protein-like surface antigen
MKACNTVRFSRTALCASAASIIIGSAGAARAQPWQAQPWQPWAPVPYVAIAGGVNFASNPSLQGVQDLGTGLGPYPISTVGQSRLATGWVALIAEGLDFRNGWRAELEESYRHNSGARFNVQAEGSTSVGIDRSTFALMINLWRDFLLFNQLSMHLGGGLGLAEVGMNVTSTFGGTTPSWQGVGAYQAGVGLGYLLGPRLTVTLDYRLFGLFWRDSSNVTAPTTCGVKPSPAVPCHGDTTERVNLLAANGLIDQSILIGLRYNLMP